jgi:tagatose 6-phosphate kinase
MILTVTLNPLLERRYNYPRIFLKKENRNGKSEITAGGKGINVSRQLNNLKIDNIALTFLGGTNGKLLKQILINEKINFSSIRTASETRDAALIFEESEKTLTTYFGKNPGLQDAEVEEFKLKLEKMIRNSEIVVFAGSSPSSISDSIFPFGIYTANKYDKISICDTYGDHLKDCIKAKPTVLRNNIAETEGSLNILLKNEKEVLNYLEYLYDSGIKQAHITNGAKPSYSSNFCYKYKIENPAIDCIDPTGSGDAFTAGTAFGLHNDLTFEETLRTAASLGTANASKFETCSTSLDEIEKIKSQIKISTIGKKIKSLDVP